MNGDFRRETESSKRVVDNGHSVSKENLELVQRGFAHFRATGDFLDEIVAPDFIWDMSKFRDWPEQQTYEGIEGTRAFLRDWMEAWDDWQIELDAIHEAGDKVVVVLRQHGRSKTTGLEVDMTFAQVWTIRDGKQARMEMYADPADAFEATGLSP
jgi:ketosteroid isomerase-like protein